MLKPNCLTEKPKNITEVVKVISCGRVSLFLFVYKYAMEKYDTEIILASQGRIRQYNRTNWNIIISFNR